MYNSPINGRHIQGLIINSAKNIVIIIRVGTKNRLWIWKFFMEIVGMLLAIITATVIE